MIWLVAYAVVALVAMVIAARVLARYFALGDTPNGEDYAFAAVLGVLVGLLWPFAAAAFMVARLAFPALFQKKEPTA